MEKTTNPNHSLDTREQLETVESSIIFYLDQLRNANTGRASRGEYISELKDIFDIYSCKLSIDEREDLKLSDIIGSSLSDLTVVSINDITPERRGDLVLEDARNRYYSLSVTDLPENFSASVGYRV